MLKLKRSEYRALSGIISGIGNILFGAFVAGVVVLPLDLTKTLVLVLELILAIFAWYLAIVFAQRGRL